MTAPAVLAGPLTTALPMLLPEWADNTVEALRWSRIRNLAKTSGRMRAQGRAGAAAYWRTLAYRALLECCLADDYEPLVRPTSEEERAGMTAALRRPVLYGPPIAFPAA